MGDVYLGRHQEIESQVAIKVLHPEHVSDPMMERRFLDEARAVNRVDHPSLVRIHDCGRDEEVGVFLVMELLRGDTLRQRLKSAGRLSPEETVRLLVQLTSALTQVHAEGVVHRDLKPENIMLVADPLVPGGERVKILDFGIAKLKEGETSSSHTKTGAVFGTPLYMSPEQCQDAKSVDPRSDIYSLGAICYELLCGQPPYRADSVYALVRKHLTEEPIPLVERDPAIPEELDRVVLKALAVLADERYETAAAFGQALESALTSHGHMRTLAWGVKSPGTGREPEPLEPDSDEEHLKTVPAPGAADRPRVFTQDTTEPPEGAAQAPPRVSDTAGVDDGEHDEVDPALAATDMAPASLSPPADEDPMEPQDSLASAEISEPPESGAAPPPPQRSFRSAAMVLGLVTVVGGIIAVSVLKGGRESPPASPAPAANAPVPSETRPGAGSEAAPVSEQAPAAKEPTIVVIPVVPDARAGGEPASTHKTRAVKRRQKKTAARKRPPARPEKNRPASPPKKRPRATSPDDEMRVRKLGPASGGETVGDDDLRVRKLPSGTKKREP